MQLQIYIIGGGAAGFMAAISAAETFTDAKVTILEKNRTVLNKVRVSGGGRCNVTNGAESVAMLCKGYPRGAKFLRKPYQKFNNQHIIKWFEDRGVPLKTEADGRVFPVSNNSQTIIDALMSAAAKAKVTIKMSAGLSKINVLEVGFELELLTNEKLYADKVIVTTGGNPQLSGYDWLASLGHSIVKPVPSLFTFNVPNSPFHELMGVAVQNAKIRIAASKLESQGPLLFTHWGLSGPAILKASAWGARELADRNYEFMALINFSNFQSDEAARAALAKNRTDIEFRNKLVKSQTINDLPSRLWTKLVTLSNIPDTMRWVDLPTKNLNRLAEYLTNCPFEVYGKTTFKDEFVTCGGVELSEIDVNTMESTKHKGLFFAGEVLDIDGITGGYNFQSAWTTGYLAGSNCSKNQIIYNGVGLANPTLL
jgi:predicted Rossmann fold flavoprotein